jgi:hypothetical protein
MTRSCASREQTPGRRQRCEITFDAVRRLAMDAISPLSRSPRSRQRRRRVAPDQDAIKPDEIPVYDNVPRSFDGLKQFLGTLDSRFAPGNLAEGIVFHHPDGRRAKIKRKDFVPGRTSEPG